MNMITIQWEIPEEMKPYIDSTNKLRQNAILLYPYILDKTISHGRAAEILECQNLICLIYMQISDFHILTYYK